ncbi:MAG: hypothetical protein P8Z36_15620 [Gemmatimonadota bacterium]
MDHRLARSSVNDFDAGATFSEAAPIFALLNGLAERLGIAGIDQLWLFPPRRVADAETADVVLSAFHDDPGRRRVFTAHYAALTDRKGRLEIEEHVEERGIAPTERIGRLVEGVLQRVEDELAASPPRAARIDGDPGRWNELVESLRTDPRWGGAQRQYVNIAPPASSPTGGSAPPAPAPTGGEGNAGTGGFAPPFASPTGGQGEGGTGGSAPPFATPIGGEGDGETG